MSKLQFSLNRDFETIPYQPLNANELSELRFQIKNVTQERLHGEVRLVEDSDSEIVLWKDNDAAFLPSQYYFKRVYLPFSEGEHALKLQWKVDGEDVFSEASITLMVEKANKPILSGAFVKLRGMDFATKKRFEDMDESQWTQMADAAADMGLKLLIAFVTLQTLPGCGEQLYANYPSSIFPRSPMAVDGIDVLLREAEKNGQRVMIGLGEPLAQTPENVKIIMQELFSMYGKYTSFYGWYSSAEVNLGIHNEDSIWDDWKKIREAADQLSPVKPVMTSPWCDNFRNTADMDHDFLARLEAGLGKFDILMPQDMCGHIKSGRNGGWMPPAEGGRMFRTLQPLCKAGGVHLWANCESFDFNESETALVPRYVNGGMYGELGFLQQIKEAAPYTEKVLTYTLSGMFTAPWQTPRWGGSAAVEQYEKYMEYQTSYCRKRRQISYD